MTEPTAFVKAVVVVACISTEGLLENARSAGCNKVQLLSHKRHAADGAHRLYVQLGFEPELRDSGFISRTSLPPVRQHGHGNRTGVREHREC